MCSLFGLIDYGHTLSGRQKTRILSVVSKECECRGIDAAGIAYNSGGKLRIYKRPGPAHKLRFSIPNDAYVVMGHTRMTTQGNARHNFNNHPFAGRVNGVSFALAHNGVLFNEYALRRQFKLPDTRIQTDSYAAVQILEQQKALTPAAMKFMAEQAEGTFVFSVLDQADNLTLIRGDNPLCLYHYPYLGLYLYASTEPILQAAVRQTVLADQQEGFIPVEMGELLSIDAQGRRTITPFEPNDPFCYYPRNFRCHDICRSKTPETAQHIAAIKAVGERLGYSPEWVDRLLAEGFTLEEVEDAIYCGS